MMDDGTTKAASGGGVADAESAAPARRRRFRLVSGGTLLILAALLAVPYVVCHFMGGREHVSVLAGTSFADSAGVRPSLALAYVGSYAVLVFVVPVLAMAGGLFILIERVCRGRSRNQSV